MPPTAPGSTTSLTLASPALPLPAKTASTSSRLRPPTRLPFRRLPSHPWWRLPWHPWSHHEGLRRDVQGDEEGELQPETQNILSRGEPASRTRTKSFGVARLIFIFAFPPPCLDIKSQFQQNIQRKTKLKCHETTLMKNAIKRKRLGMLISGLDILKGMSWRENRTRILSKSFPY